MREHLVEQPDGSWFYRYFDVVAAAYREMARFPPPWETLRCRPSW